MRLLRNSFQYAVRQDWDKIAQALKPASAARDENVVAERFGEAQDTWGKTYSAIIQLREKAWAEFMPFLTFDVEIRTDE